MEEFKFKNLIVLSILVTMFTPQFALAQWPVVKYKNGTVGVKNEGGEVHVQSKELRVNGNLNIEGKLVVNGSDFTVLNSRISNLDQTLGINSSHMVNSSSNVSVLSVLEDVKKTINTLVSQPSSVSSFGNTPGTVIMQGSTEYKAVAWEPEHLEGWYSNSYTGSCHQSSASFVDVMVREGVSYDEIFTNCSWPVLTESLAGRYGVNSCQNVNASSGCSWKMTSPLSKACVLMILVDKFAHENWKMMGAPEYANIGYGGVTFKRTSSGTNLPRCMPPGGDRYQYNGTHWICICHRAYVGSTCEILNVVPIFNDAFQNAFRACISEAPIDGLCQSYGATSGYGMMPDWDTSKVTAIGSLGYTSTSTIVFNANITRWDTSQFTRMGEMFKSCQAFNQDIGGWNTAQVTNMNRMFYGAYAFNQDIGSWNTAQVTNMSEMFRSASSFNHYIGGWDTVKLNYFSNIFAYATAFLAKYTCSTTSQPSLCKEIRSSWIAPPPPPSAS